MVVLPMLLRSRRRTAQWWRPRVEYRVRRLLRLLLWWR